MINLLTGFLPSGGRLIPLTRGQFAIIDDGDHGDLSRWKWCARWSAKTRSFYALHNRWDPALGKTRATYMHRSVVRLADGDGLEVDHINHDTLDNRRSNLRVVTSRGNGENMRRQSRHGVGVAFHPRCKSKPFEARAVFGGKLRHLGYYATPHDARMARDFTVGIMGRNPRMIGRVREVAEDSVSIFFPRNPPC